MSGTHTLKWKKKHYQLLQDSHWDNREATWCLLHSLSSPSLHSPMRMKLWARFQGLWNFLGRRINVQKWPIFKALGLYTGQPWPHLKTSSWGIWNHTQPSQEPKRGLSKKRSTTSGSLWIYPWNSSPTMTYISFTYLYQQIPSGPFPHLSLPIHKTTQL
jgi:hypothetical protein